jgi:hypothetical protein
MALAGAGASTLLGSTAFTVWNQSTVNEKVYTISVMIIAVVSWLALRWRDRRGEPKSERLLLVALYLIVLGSTNHLMSVLPLPALGIFVLVVGPSVLLRRSLWIRGIPLVLLGLSFNIFLPIRSAQDPIINEGEPTCETATGAAVAVFSNGKRGCPALADNLQRTQYRKPPATERQATFKAQLLNWYQYFDWQWARGADPSELPGTGRTSMTVLFLMLGMLGLWAAWVVDREAAVYLSVLAAVLTVGLVYYLNFKYGFSLYPEVTGPYTHEVRERDYFFIAGFMLWGVLAGMGLTWTWAVLSRQMSSPRAPLWTSPVLLLALIPLGMNLSWASRAGDWAPRDWAYDLLMSLEPYSLIFTNGDNDTFPLWYLQEVEGIRKDVTVIVGEYLNTSWYPLQLQRHTAPGRQRPLEGEGAALYEAPPVPTRSILAVEPRLVDSVAAGSLQGDLSVPFTNLVVSYPEGTFLDRRQRIALRMIHDSVGERPVYFASQAGLMNELGLTRWGVRHGLAVRLDVRNLDGPVPEGYVRASPGVGGEWFHYPRTRLLYDDVYRFRGFRDREVWADRSTVNIPYYFYALAVQLMDVGQTSGMDEEGLSRLAEDARSFLRTYQGGALGAPGDTGS